ncbi:hypothetical protein FQR65_LT11119 [Abscondita terminalis]|nr:hypothetical protein FQR65_LT11119 [Abscondita terminalis]
MPGCGEYVLFFVVIFSILTAFCQSGSLSLKTIENNISKEVPFNPSLGVQIEPFKQLQHGLRSDPIVIIDEKTFFVPNLHYDGIGLDAHFWVSKGTEPSPKGTLVPDETGSNSSISAYTGQSVYITLPHNVTITDIEYFGVWCIQCHQYFGHTTIPKNITVVKSNRNHTRTFDNKEIVRVKKCCPFNEVLTLTGCKSSKQKFNLNVNVHKHNLTHFDDEPLPNVAFVPFVQTITCEFHKYNLFCNILLYICVLCFRYALHPNKDIFPLLQNGSLMKSRSGQILSMDQYCFESVNLSGNWVTTAIVCFTSAPTLIDDYIFYTYTVGVVISATCLIFTAMIFWRFKIVRDTRGKCIVIYSTSMAIVYICLVIAQFSELDQEPCPVTGNKKRLVSFNVNFVSAYLILFASVSSFTWLTMVSWETLCKILFHYKDDNLEERKRFWVYVVTPELDQNHGLSKNQHTCWFDQNKTSSIYLYIPICVAIICNFALAAVMKIKLIQCQQRNNSIWRLNEIDLQPMFRSVLIVTIVMSVCRLLKLLPYFMNIGDNMWKGIDIINSLQGIFVFLIFVTHRPVNEKVVNAWRRYWRTVVSYKSTKQEIESNIPLTEK